MSLVPVIDLAPAAAGEKGPVAAAVAEACGRVGFLVVTGHDVPAAVIERGWAAARAFFDLPEAAKRSVVMPRPGYPYGYSPVAGGRAWPGRSATAGRRTSRRASRSARPT